MIDDGQGITILTVPGGELPFEIGGPQIIGRAGHNRRGPRMLPVPTAPTRRDQPPTSEQVSDRTGGRPVLRWPVVLEPRQQLAWSPARMLPTRLHDGGGHRGLDAMGTVMRGAAPLLQAHRPVRFVPIEPLVARPTTDAIA